MWLSGRAARAAMMMNTWLFSSGVTSFVCVKWALFSCLKRRKNRPAEGKTSPYPEDYRGHWQNTQEFYVFNTHFFTGRSGYNLAKLNSAKLILERINAFNRFGEWTKDRPVFLLGDFNARPGGEVHRTFVGDGESDDPFLLKDSVKGDRGIDWILYKGNVNVLHYEKVDYNVDGAYPSDHKPILVEFQISNKYSRRYKGCRNNIKNY